MDEEEVDEVLQASMLLNGVDQRCDVREGSQIRLGCLGNGREGVCRENQYHLLEGERPLKECRSDTILALDVGDAGNALEALENTLELVAVRDLHRRFHARLQVIRAAVEIAPMICSQCSRPEASTTMSRRLWAPSTSTR